MEIWIVTSNTAKYSFLEHYYKLKFFDSYKSMGKWLMCADIARPGFAFFDLLVGQESLFTYRSSRQIEETLRLLSFIVVLPCDEMDLARKCYSIGALGVLSDPFKPNITRAFIENHIEKAPEYDVPIKNTFKGMNLDITPTENDLLEVFAKSKDYTVSGLTLRRFVWGEQKVTDKALDTHLNNIKKKIEKIGYTISKAPISKTDDEFSIHKIGLSPYQQELDRQITV